MERFIIRHDDEAEIIVEGILRDLELRVLASPPDMCPVSVASVFMKQCGAQTCGKCVPCRIGLARMEDLIEEVLDGNGGEELVDLIHDTAVNIVQSADCAIGCEAADLVLKGMHAFRDDYIAHATGQGCIIHDRIPIPCVSRCPANIHIPGYIALVREGRFDDAVRLIRKDNPFPAVCGLICEHPCEKRCRRTMLGDAVNIRGLKRYATENAGDVPAPKPLPPTGKKVAVVGAGPSGLTAAYYLSLMGHEVTVYERRSQAGGMLRYGIPAYRLPRKILEDEINTILSTGAELKTGMSLGANLTFDELEAEYDSIYISIGAHGSKSLGAPGESFEGVFSAIELLGRIGDNHYPDIKGKEVVVIGGGNVAMDATRTAKRLGAATVTCVYRRRVGDMTAMQEEVKGAMAEGCEIIPMYAPIAIEGDKKEKVTGLKIQRQMAGPLDKSGRPAPIPIDGDYKLIPADVVILAIGQDVEREHLDHPTPSSKKGTIFYGGDCASDPATVILAIAAGKQAATMIDRDLGFDHELEIDVDIPKAKIRNKQQLGRANMTEREALKRARDLDDIENSYCEAEAMQEADRCLRCDHFGFGGFRKIR